MYDHHEYKPRWMKAPLIILFAAVGILVFGWLVSVLWNYTVPVLFHGPEVTYWQAVALLALAKILFSGFHGGHHRHHRGGGPPWAGKDWKKEWDTGDWSKYIQRMMWMKQMQKVYWMKHLTPEEREKMKEEWKKRVPDDFESWEKSEGPDDQKP